MEQDEIRKLKVLMEKYGVADFYYENGDVVVNLQIAPKAMGEIVSPHAGLFFAQHPMSKHQPLDQNIKTAGEVIGFIKSGLLIRPVVNMTNCLISDAKISDGTHVNYGQPVYDVVG